MAYSRAKEVSESYKGSEITFDKTTAGAVSKGFTSTEVQSAIVEAKPVAATTAAAGIVRAATDAEAEAGSDINAYIQPDQLQRRVVNYANSVIIPQIPTIPPAPAIPTAVYGGSGSSAAMQTTYAALPVGSSVVFEEAYTQAYGVGNGTAYRTAYRRRTLIRTSNSGWLMVIQ